MKSKQKTSEDKKILYLKIFVVCMTLFVGLMIAEQITTKDNYIEAGGVKLKQSDYLAAKDKFSNYMDFVVCDAENADNCLRFINIEQATKAGNLAKGK